MSQEGQQRSNLGLLFLDIAVVIAAVPERVRPHYERTFYNQIAFEKCKAGDVPARPHARWRYMLHGNGSTLATPGLGSTNSHEVSLKLSCKRVS